MRRMGPHTATTKLPAPAGLHRLGQWRAARVLDGGGPIRRARRAVPLADIAEETSDSMPSSIAGPLTDGVPVARGRARLATAVNVARTPGGGARNQATIRTTRGVMKPHQHGTGAPHAASSSSTSPPCSFESLFRMGHGPRFHCLGRTRTPFCRVSQATQKRRRQRRRWALNPLS